MMGFFLLKRDTSSDEEEGLEVCFGFSVVVQRVLRLTVCILLEVFQGLSQRT